MSEKELCAALKKLSEYKAAAEAEAMFADEFNAEASVLAAERNAALRRIEGLETELRLTTASLARATADLAAAMRELQALRSAKSAPWMQSE